MDKRQLPDLKLKMTGDSGIIEGYGAIYGNRDLVGDICEPGCFKASLERHREADTMPAMLSAHDQRSNPVGRWTEIYEDEVGLYVVGKLTMATQAAKDVFELASDGALSLSIGYTTIKQHYDEKREANILEEVDVREISFVALAANPQAKILSVKSLETVRDFERALRRDYGLSAGDAKKLVYGGWKAYRPDFDEEQKRIAGLIRGSANEHFGVKRNGNRTSYRRTR